MTDYEKLVSVLQDIGINVTVLENKMIDFEPSLQDESHTMLISFDENGYIMISDALSKNHEVEYVIGPEEYELGSRLLSRNCNNVKLNQANALDTDGFSLPSSSAKVRSSVLRFLIFS